MTTNWQYFDFAASHARACDPAKQRRAMLAFHEKAARAYAAVGRHDQAAAARAAAQKIMEKKK